jgi:hypothetical protein
MEVPTPAQLRRGPFKMAFKHLKPTSIPSNPENCFTTSSPPIIIPAPRFIIVEFKTTGKAVKQINLS